VLANNKTSTNRQKLKKGKLNKSEEAEEVQELLQ